MLKEVTDLKEHLKNSSYKATGQRQSILNILAENSGRHLNADEVYKLLSQKDARIGIATVYRTLGLLEKLKLINKVYLDDGCIRYQISAANNRHEHHHLICEKCGLVIDIQEDLLDSLEKQVLDNNSFHVNNHRLKLYGICGKCWNKN
jgi:Fur family ferric uptake transcriptional regulator